MPKAGRKLRFVMKWCGIGEDRFTTEFMRDNPTAKKAQITGWISDRRKAHGKNKKRLADYFRPWVPSIMEWWWDLPDAHVEKLCREDRERRRTMDVVASVDLQSFIEDEVRCLCGTYRTWRYAFSNIGEVAVEVMRVFEPERDKMHYLWVEIVGIALLGAHQREKFTGKMFKFGDIYYVKTSFAVDGQPATGRVRYIQFPVEPYNTAIKERWGIVSGATHWTKEPVAARFLAERLNTNPIYEKIVVRRIAPMRVKHEVPKRIQRLISNDIKRTKVGGDKNDWLLTVSRARKEG